MKIAFLTSLDANDRRPWSGTHFHTLRALEKHCGDVTPIGPVHLKSQSGLRVMARLIKALTGKRFAVNRSPWLSRKYGRIFTERLRRGNYDLVYASSASTEIAFVQSRAPIVYMADATFANVLDYYPENQNLLNISKRDGFLLERNAIQKSSFLIYPSEWAAQSAINDFGADPSSIGIVPFGANLDIPPSAESLRQKKSSEVCRLLFLAVEWGRKGGDLAVQTFRELKKSGIKTKLTICGCIPPEGVSDPDLEVTGFLNKNIPANRERVEQLLLNSDFMLIPTRADCTPIVFCEASAFGLPSVTTETGGVGGAVRHGINGLLLPLAAGPKEIANAIVKVFQDKASFNALAQSARTEYETRLNWDAWGAEVSKIIRQRAFSDLKPS